MFTGCSPVVHRMLIGCSLDVHWIFTGCSPDVIFLLCCNRGDPAPTTARAHISMYFTQVSMYFTQVSIYFTQISIYLTHVSMNFTNVLVDLAHLFMSLGENLSTYPVSRLHTRPEHHPWIVGREGSTGGSTVHGVQCAGARDCPSVWFQHRCATADGESPVKILKGLGF
jgi:hypothetical protein